VFYRIELMHSCNLINVWREIEFRDLMQHIVFVSIFTRRWCLHCHGQCYLKSFAKECMTRSRKMQMYDYSWDAAYIVLEDAITNRLRTYAWPTPGPSKSVIIAEMVLTLSWAMLFEVVCKRTHYPTPGPSQSMIIGETVPTLSWTMLIEFVGKRMHYPLQDHENPRVQLRRCLHDHGRRYLKSSAKVRITHPRTIEIYDHGWEGAYIVMDDTIWNRVQKYAWPTPAPPKSMIITETVLTLSWTMLFEIVCKSTQGPLQDHQNLWL
jgi:hypothetical protein